jgi:hypothetical protein
MFFIGWNFKIDYLNYAFSDEIWTFKSKNTQIAYKIVFSSLIFFLSKEWKSD